MGLSDLRDYYYPPNNDSEPFPGANSGKPGWSYQRNIPTTLIHASLHPASYILCDWSKLLLHSIPPGS